ncbi:MAG: hypothetical protein IT295_06625 [Dehalococcoidia bacterium]|nr:hypothetical protein [Dehalococcoidia bacterium]
MNRTRGVDLRPIPTHEDIAATPLDGPRPLRCWSEMTRSENWYITSVSTYR